MSIQIQTSLNRLNPNVPCFLKPYVEKITAPVNIITLAYHPNGFLFDEDYAKMVVDNGKPVVVLNFEEHGWHESWRHENMPGGNFAHSLMYGLEEERRRLHEFLKWTPLAAYFMREYSEPLQAMFADEPGSPVLPIELLSPSLSPPPIPIREEYLSRIPGVFSWCGNSHPDRVAFSDLLQMADNGSGQHNARMIHHLDRSPINKVMDAQGYYLTSLCLPGAGVKTFRDAEACWNSVPIMADLGMEYRVKWDDSNAIMLPAKDGRVLIEESLNKIQACLDDKEGMWERMLNAHENAKRMQIDNYMAEINQEILKRL